MRPIWRMAGLCLSLIPTLAAAHPFGVEDLLKLQSRGETTVDPGGRWLVISSQRPHDTAGRYDFDMRTGYVLTSPLVVDLEHPGPARPLLPQDPGTGYKVGPFSPDGRHIVVLRHRDALWETGVVTLANGVVQWLGIGADDPVRGSAVQWLSNDALLVIALEPGDQPMYLRRGRQAQETLPGLWAKSRDGRQPSFTVFGSGRYLNDRAPPIQSRLLRVEIGSGALTPLAQGALQDIQLSPDKRHVAILMQGLADQPGPNVPARQGDVGGRRTVLKVLDLQAGSMIEPLPDRDILWNLLSWSPSGRSLLLYSRTPGQDWTMGRLQRLDVPSGVVSEPAAGKLKPAIDWAPYLQVPSVQAGWLGESPLVMARPAGVALEDRADWFVLGSEGMTNLTAELPGSVNGPNAVIDQALIIANASAVWRIDPQGRRSKVAAKGGQLIVSPAGDAGYRGTFNPGMASGAGVAWLVEKDARQRRASPLASSRVDLRLPPQSAQDYPLNFTPHGLVQAHIDARGVQTISLLDGPRRHLLATFNAQLANIDLPSAQPISHPGADGKTLTSWLYLPAGHKTGERLPLIVTSYPDADAPSLPVGGRPDLKNFMTNQNVMLGKGYAVLVASYARSSSSRDPAEGFPKAIVDAVDAAAATGQIDPERIALWGHSFGGYATLVTITKTSRFKAAVATMGLSDLTSFMTTSMPHYRVSPADGLGADVMFGWGETSQGQLATTPWEDPERFVRNSPIFAAGAIKTPLLIVNSDMDYASTVQGEEIFTALWRQSKDAKLITFWGEMHVLLSPANIRAYYDQAFAFLTPLIGEGRPSP
jgi:dipeptidyl aminopeptidase/acylaminoacyl peptidase